MLRRFALSLLATVGFLTVASSQPKVLVLPFDPIMDSLYAWTGGKEAVLDYQKALWQMLTAEMTKDTNIRIIEARTLDRMSSLRGNVATIWNDMGIADSLGKLAGADYVVIGTYGEFTKTIRVDARVLVVAARDIPPENNATVTVGVWEDLPRAASQLAPDLIRILAAGGSRRLPSRGFLFPEGNLAEYDPFGESSPGVSRLVVWVNAPAPVIRARPPAVFGRCERIDLVGTGVERLKEGACRFAILPSGKVELSVEHRGFLPFHEVLDLAPSRAYRLEVNLRRIEGNQSR